MLIRLSSGDPSLCEFFLKVGVVGAIIALIVGIITDIAQGVG